MKRHDPQSVGDIIRLAIEQAGDKDTFARRHASYLWPEAVGPAINRLTTRRWLEGDTLHVCIASAPLRNDLAFLTQTIINRINSLAGQKAISRIVIH